MGEQQTACELVSSGRAACSSLSEWRPGLQLPGIGVPAAASRLPACYAELL